MSITIWDLFKYLFKWKYVILLVTVLSIGAAYLYVNRNQTYSAKAVIRYDDKCISNGKTLDGRMFDSNEIKSPAVILNVLKDLGYEGKKKIEPIREHISISPITPKSVESLKTAKEKLGEEYVFFPKTFVITYDGNGSFETTRDVLSSVIANYFKYYSETYLYLATLNEVDYSVNKKNFDYIEQAEQINENIKQTIELLETYSRNSANYRSPTTGLTFDDLKKEFELLDKFDVPNIFSKIYEGQVTLNKELLISKYTERLEDNLREQSNLHFKTDLVLDRMKTYVEADEREREMFTRTATAATDGNAGEMTEKPMTNTMTSMLTDIERDDLGTIDEQTTYDTLITNYANDSVAANNREVDADYCRFMLQQFMAEKDPNLNFAAYENEVRESIADVLNTLSVLYRKTNINISDYNAYIPALHIHKLSGVSYYTTLSRSVYMLIGALVGFVLSCVLAIGYEIMRKYSLFASNDKEAEEDADGEVGAEDGSETVTCTENKKENEDGEPAKA